MFNFRNIFGRHEIDEWRDEQVIGAAATINQLAADLTCAFVDELSSASWRDALIAQGRFISTRIAPQVRATSEPVVGAIIGRANAALKRIVEYQAVWHDSPRHLPEGEDPSAAIRDVAWAAAPLAGGVAAAATLPAMAITTSTAFFGLMTTTAISWPVVIGGGAFAGAGIATGVINTSRIWSKAEERLRRRVRDHVIAVLLRGPTGQPAILEQMEALFATTANEAKNR
jgi:hypothetical protein